MTRRGPMVLIGAIAMTGLSVLAISVLPTTSAHAIGFSLDGGSDYVLLYEGMGGNTLHITNVTINGNTGVGDTGTVADSGPSTINGRLDFSAPNSGQFHSTNGSNVGPTSVNYNVAGVTSALNDLSGLNSTLGAETGTPTAINGNTTINANAGTFDAMGNSVFTVTSFNTTNSNVLTINGDGVHNVVLNFDRMNVNFNNQVALHGLSPDQVLYNFVGGSNLAGGPTLQINTNASSFPHSAAQGVWLDPNGAISVVNANINGRVFGGDTHDFQYVSGSTITAPLTTSPSPVPEPASLLLLGSGIAGLVARRRRPQPR